MRLRAKLVSSVWLLIGATTSVLLAQDLAKLGGDIQRGPAAVLVAVPFIAFCVACFALAYGLFTSRTYSARLGVSLSLVVGLVLLTYVALNFFMLLRASLLASFLASVGGLLGIFVCWVTFKESRSLSPNPSSQRTASGGR